MKLRELLARRWYFQLSLEFGPVPDKDIESDIESDVETADDPKRSPIGFRPNPSPSSSPKEA